jgi:hypothetical protein
MLKRVLVVACVLGALGFAIPARADAPTWTNDAPVVVATQGNETGVALPDGRAMVMGGVGYNRAEERAQLYDPVNGSWSLAAPMHQARWLPKAVNLPGARVLVLGLGDYQAAGNGTYEIYDATAGTWSASQAGPATSWNGQLVALADGTPLYIDPANSQRYDVPSGTWTPVTPPPATSANNYVSFAVLLHTGEVLVVLQGYQSSVGSYLYDPASDAWRSVGAPPTFPQEGPTSAAALSDGRVIAIASPVPGNTSSGDIFDPATETWSAFDVPFANLVDTRVGTTLDGRVIAVGGMKYEPCGDTCYSGYPQKSSWTFDPATNAWAQQADMAHGRSRPVLITLPTGTLAVFGYYLYENIGSSELFGEWTPPPPPPPIKASIDDAQATEGTGESTMTFTVTLEAPARSDLHLRLDTVRGTAKSPGDYAPGPIYFSIEAGATSAAVGVTINGDTDPEAKETFKVVVSGGDLDYTDNEGVGTIIDDDFGVCASLPVNGRTCIGFQNPG